MTDSKSIIQSTTGTSLYYYSKDVLFMVEKCFRIENQKRKKSKRARKTNTTSKCGRENGRKTEE